MDATVPSELGDRTSITSHGMPHRLAYKQSDRGIFSTKISLSR